ncbi:MAG TPA: hypothetical protein VGN20_13385 [Mucilaginibacter sp.]|jgi:hypothetical protein
MEKLTINIPDSKSEAVKQFLKEIGVIVQMVKPFDKTAYRKKLDRVGVWSDANIKSIEEVRTSFDSFKSQE